MSDVAAVMMAVSAALGAWTARPVPLWLAVVAAMVAAARRWPMLLWLAVALAASAFAARSWSGLHPVAVGDWSGSTTLVSDPAPTPDGSGALAFVTRVRGKRLQATVRGPTAGLLRDRLAGETIAVDGRVSALPRLPVAVRRQLAARHVAGRLSIRGVSGRSPATGAAGVANGLRRTLVRGASSLPAERRALFTGFVLGDDRGQRPDVVADFRASGLAHLLVVSGENVAFVLALAAPLLGRMPLGMRLAAGLATLGLFGALTRWEPSVLRAEAMAAIGLVAIVLGRPVSAIRLLALAVTGLLLVDPLLVGSIGFLLSVGASAGIALLAKPLTDALPGPRPIATAAAVTIAAQIGVAPAFLPAFGGLPVATLPANLVALPAAGPVMMWGLAAGVPAGFVGGPVARLLHVPTALAVGWVAGVASVAARLPLGQLRGPHLAVLAMAAVAVIVTARHRRRRLTALALVVGLGAIAEPGVVLAVDTAHAHATSGAPITSGATLWRLDGAVVLLVDRARPADVLTGLRARSVDHVDLLLFAGGGSPAAEIGRGIRVGRAERATRGDSFAVGSVSVTIGDRAGPLTVTVVPMSEPP